VVDDVVILVVVIGGLLVLLLLALVGFVVRRVLLTRPVGTFDCSLRREAGHGNGRWMLGVARYEADRLEWFRVFGLSPRPLRTLSRSRLTIEDRRSPGKGEGRTVMAGAVIVRCHYGGASLEFAMSEAAYNGFAAWIESAPPAPPLFSP